MFSAFPGTITPANSPGPFTVKRRVDNAACYGGVNGSHSMDCKFPPIPFDDTDTYITQTPVSGQVFNLDAPGWLFDSQSQDIIRMRIDFEVWVVGPDGVTVISPMLKYYTRTSCHYYSTDSQPVPTTDVGGDNQAGMGTSRISWNLQ